MTASSKPTPPRSNKRTSRAVTASQSNIPWGIIAAVSGLVVLVGLIAFATYNTVNTRNQQYTPIEGVEQFLDLTRNHTSSPMIYAQNPPAGGDHDPTWLNCGIYNEPVRNENAVHALEHGAVWITYQPDLPAETIAQLKQLVRGRTFVILSPYPGLPSPIVASAWGVQLKPDGISDPRLTRFLTKYIQGPQTPEPGAVCTGGVGTPNG